MSRLRVSKALALLVPFFLFAAPGLKGQLATSAVTSEIQKVFERSKEAVVKIQAVDEHGPLSGTGFFIDPNGTLYTSYTVGGESRDIVVLQGDKKFNATRVIADPRSGIAILKV